MEARIQTSADARGLRIAIAVSRYHEHVTNALREGAVGRYVEAGGEASDLLVVDAPGAFELTAICAAIAEHHRPDAVVALGCVITGETTHDRYICESVAGGLGAIAARTGVPVAFGVLTCQTMEQARARAGGEKGNKGAEAMTAAIEAANIIRSLAAPAMAEEGGDG